MVWSIYVVFNKHIQIWFLHCALTSDVVREKKSSQSQISYSALVRCCHLMSQFLSIRCSVKSVMLPGDSSLRRSDWVCGGVPYVFYRRRADQLWPSAAMPAKLQRSALSVNKHTTFSTNKNLIRLWVIYAANSHISFPSPTLSFIPAFLFCKSFPLQPFFFFFRTDYMIPQTFTVTSEHSVGWAGGMAQW